MTETQSSHHMALGLAHLIFFRHRWWVIINAFISYLLRNVALPFRWKLYKPFFRCPVSPGCHVRPSVGSSQVPRTPEDLGVFVITPNMGTIPPHQSVDFILESSPREVSAANLVSRLRGCLNLQWYTWIEVFTPVALIKWQDKIGSRSSYRKFGVP